MHYFPCAFATVISKVFFFFFLQFIKIIVFCKCTILISENIHNLFIMAHFNLWVKKQIYNFSIQSLKRFRFPPVLLLI